MWYAVTATHPTFGPTGFLHVWSPNESTILCDLAGKGYTRASVRPLFH